MEKNGEVPNTGAPSPSMENSGGAPNTGAPEEVPPVVEVREQDRLMPIANVTRIMRRMLPPHAKISDNAKELIQESTSEFISFLTGEANERCLKSRRKILTAEDILWAMDNLGFDDYVQPFTAYLQRMRDIENNNGVGVVNNRLAAATGPRAPAPAPPLVPVPVAAAAQGLMQMQRGAMYAPRPPAPVQQQGYAIGAMPLQVRAPPPPLGGQRPVGDGEGSSRGEKPADGEGSSR